MPAGRPLRGSGARPRRLRARAPSIAAVRVGVITGTGTYSLAGARASRTEDVPTRYGTVPVVRLELDGGIEVLHVSRHGPGHARLSNHVAHRANIAALGELGADCAVGLTVCGAVDGSLALGSL